MAALASLQTSLENATAQFATYQAAYASQGYLPNFSVDGVSINWSEYESSMLDKIKRLQEMLTAQLTLDAQQEPFELKSDLG